MTKNANALSMVPEIKTRGLSDADIESLHANEPTDVNGWRAFQQGLVEAGNGGEKNPDFPDELRTKIEYGIGFKVIELVQERKEGT
ncbi:MAG TPA: hypothetical protein VLF79_03910 [Candidatus Saccharimonadales bacterium]|nr:hypothetical protein [Candidatus Saccharimonadales bacterium]